eukprot:gene7447-biopygen13578
MPAPRPRHTGQKWHATRAIPARRCPVIPREKRLCPRPVRARCRLPPTGEPLWVRRGLEHCVRRSIGKKTTGYTDPCTRWSLEAGSSEKDFLDQHFFIEAPKNKSPKIV